MAVADLHEAQLAHHVRRADLRNSAQAVRVQYPAFHHTKGSRPCPGHALQESPPVNSVVVVVVQELIFFLFGHLRLLLYYDSYPFSKVCACRWDWRRDGLSRPPLNVLAFIQTEPAPVLFQIHTRSCLSLHVRRNGAAFENKIALHPVYT